MFLFFYFFGDRGISYIDKIIVVKYTTSVLNSNPLESHPWPLKRTVVPVVNGRHYQAPTTTAQPRRDFVRYFSLFNRLSGKGTGVSRYRKAKCSILSQVTHRRRYKVLAAKPQE